MRYSRDAVSIGDRVSLRRRLPEGGLGDVLGVVEQLSAGGVVLRRLDGELVEIAGDDVLALKRVPPSPRRRQARPDSD